MEWKDGRNGMEWNEGRKEWMDGWKNEWMEGMDMETRHACLPSGVRSENFSYTSVAECKSGNRDTML